MNNKELRKLQLTEIEILDEIDRICKKNNIEYSLIGGTLLGAVRHKGFIPWDDDIDIGMTKINYDKFTDVCLNKGELDSKYYFHSDLTDKKYWLPFIKIKKNNTTFDEKLIHKCDTHKGIFVDVFPIENFIKEQSFFQSIRAFIIKNIFEVLHYKKNFLKLKDCRKKGVVFILSLFPASILKKIRDFLLSLHKNKKTDYVVLLTGAYGIKKETFKREDLFPLTHIEFEGKKYPCFKNYDLYLTKIYGDYMKLPPVEKRVTHKPLKISFTKGKNIVNKKKR